MTTDFNVTKVLFNIVSDRSEPKALLFSASAFLVYSLSSTAGTSQENKSIKGNKGVIPTELRYS